MIRELRGSTGVITGGASGIGKALVERVHAEGARHIVVADLNGDGRLDILASGRATHNVKIYLNRGAK